MFKILGILLHIGNGAKQHCKELEGKEIRSGWQSAWCHVQKQHYVSVYKSDVISKSVTRKCPQHDFWQAPCISNVSELVSGDNLQKSVLIQTVKNENDIYTVSNTEDIDFNFTEISVFYWKAYKTLVYVCLVRHSIKYVLESWIGVLEWSVGSLEVESWSGI